MRSIPSDKLELILDACPARVAYIDRTGRYRYNNRAYQDWYATKGTNFTGKRVIDVVGESIYARTRLYRERVLAGDTIRFEFQINHQARGVIDSDISFIPDFDTNGEVDGYFVFSIDVTDRNRARQTSSQLAAALQGVSDGVELYDSTDRLVFHNAGARRLMGEAIDESGDGATFEQITRRAADHFFCDDEAKKERYVEDRIRERRNPGAPFELNSGDFWLQMRDYPTEEGGMLTTYSDISALKAREIALERVERRYEMASRAAGVGVWDWNLDTGAFYVDPGLKALLGYTEEEISNTSETWIDLVHPDDREGVAETAQRHQDGGLPEFIAEHRKLHKDGSERWFLARGRMIPTGESEPRRMVGTDFDITELKRAEAALLDSEERYRQVVELCPDPVLVHRGGINLYANPAALRFYGVEDQSDFVGTEVFDFMHPDDWDLVLERRERRETLGVVSGFQQLRFRTADGKVKVGEGNIALVPWEGEMAALSIIRDITDRRRMEDALRNSEEVLRLVTNNLPALISYIGADGRFRFVNKKYEEWFNRPSTEIVGCMAWESVAQGLDPEVSDSLVPDLRSPIRSALDGKLTTFEGYRKYRDGHNRFVRVTMVPHFEDDGTTVGVCAMVWDISQLKEREVQLRQAGDEAHRANESKSRFLAAASHDLRQPLQALNLLTFALSESVTANDDRAIVGEMGNALSAMENVLNGLIDISKLDAGVVVPVSADVSLAELFESLRGPFAVQAREKGIELKFAPTGLYVRTDPDLLARVVENILSNAIKYTSGGKVLVGCRRSGAGVDISVYDTGVGIPDDRTEQIFEEFYQLDNSERESSKGMGLGLAIVKRTAQLLDHPIRVTSELGRGSVFTVTAPSGFCPAGVEFAGAAQPKMDNALTGNQILVIEDDENVRNATVGLLRRWGAVASAASCTDAAMELIAEDDMRPDLIIADYGLPHGETGPQAIDCLRTALGCKVSGIVITGDTAPQRVRDAQMAGYHLLHKPVNPRTLRDLIQNLTTDDVRV